MPEHVVVITGASRGLGAGMAESFAGMGLKLGLCARHRPEAPAGSGAFWKRYSTLVPLRKKYSTPLFLYWCSKNNSA